ncbi:MAG: ATP-binding protein [Candidatus Thiodiazotropha sp.]
MSKIESGQISQIQRPFDLHAVIKSVLAPFEYEANMKNLQLFRQFDPDCPYHLVGDEPHLRQVLVNLFSNAVKFTQQGEIHIRISADQVHPARIALRIEVSDTGIGISEEAQRYIFEPFRQEDEDITRRFGGSGLGMNIAKQLTEHMGSKLSVASVQGQGSTFTLRLPFERQDNPPRYETLHFPDGILIVSQDNHLTDQLKSWLKKWGVNCSMQAEISSPVSTSSVIIDSRSPPHPEVILDSQSGHTTLEVILLGSEPSPDFEILSAQCAGVLPIPFDPEQLHTLLHSLQPITSDLTGGVMEATRTQLSNRKALRILVVDDNKINQLVTGNTLERAGHQVTVVDDGKSAIDTLQSDRFDLAIVDMMMPGLSGLDVIKFFRETSESSIS